MVVWIVCVAAFLGETLGARVRTIEVPPEARAGEDVSLACLVDPWPDPLYSVAWWKDGEQIYRVAVVPNLPRDMQGLHARQLVTVFSLPGLRVKTGRGLGHVVLEDVSVEASGNYTCEAVADFPSFTRSLLSGNLTVVDPPDTRPIIAGYKVRYYPGELLVATCTVLRASPLPVVTWFINSHVVEEGETKVVEVRPEPDLTTTLITRLTVPLKRHHFHRGVLNLTCGARIGRTLWSTNTITTHHARHHSAPGFSLHYKGSERFFDEDPGQQRLHTEACGTLISRQVWFFRLSIGIALLHMQAGLYL